MSSEWYLDIFIFTYFDVNDGLCDQKVFKKTIITKNTIITDNFFLKYVSDQSTTW